MKEYSILVVHSQGTERKRLLGLLSQKGYRLYQSSDCAEMIRMARQLRPSLILLEIGVKGMPIFEAAKIVEKDGISSVLFLTDRVDGHFLKALERMNLYAYIREPIALDAFFRTVDFSIKMSEKIIGLNTRIRKLERQMESRIQIEKAKGLLMSHEQLSEDEAFGKMRKLSMDQCKSLEQVSLELIRRWEGKEE